jgi:hypothetical protein
MKLKLIAAEIHIQAEALLAKDTRFCPMQGICFLASCDHMLVLTFSALEVIIITVNNSQFMKCSLFILFRVKILEISSLSSTA